MQRPSSGNCHQSVNQLTVACRSALGQLNAQGDFDVRASLIADERAWIKLRQECADRQCIAAAYNTRLTELRERI